MAKVHILKVHKDFWSALETGNKNFEVRKDDRGYAVGDILVLRRYEPELDKLSDYFLTFQVTFILSGGQYGVEVGYVVMGIKRCT